LTGNDALGIDIIAAKIMMLDWKETYLNYIANKTGMREDDISVEGLPIANVKHRFEPPRIDLPVKVQMMIYQHEYLTKVFFCSLDIVKLFQKVTESYRGKPVEIS
jgi:hypothetical protein